MMCRNHCHRGVRCVLAAAFVLALTVLPALAAGSKTEAIGTLSAPGASADLTKALADHGTRVILDDGWSADFWFARALVVSSTSAPGALYPELANGEFVGVVTFPKGASDFRGQAVPAGTYTLRYQYIPQDANHMGVSPNPDFLLAIPVASDTTPGDNLPLKRLVALSAKATATAHPAVFALAPAGSSGALTKDDQGMSIFTAEVSTAAGKTQKISIVVKGQANQ